MVPKHIIEAEQRGPWSYAIFAQINGKKQYLCVDVGAIDVVWTWCDKPIDRWSEAKGQWIANKYSKEIGVHLKIERINSAVAS